MVDCDLKSLFEMNLSDCSCIVLVKRKTVDSFCINQKQAAPSSNLDAR